MGRIHDDLQSEALKLPQAVTDWHLIDNFRQVIIAISRWKGKFDTLHAVSDYKKRVEFQTSCFLFFFQDFIQFLFLIFGPKLYSVCFLKMALILIVVS